MNSISRDYQEKRNFIRMKVDTPVSVTLETEGKRFEGVCRDLSGGGMLVELASALPVGTRLQVCIESNHGHSPMLKAEVEVTRVVAQPGEEQHPCLLGMEIVAVLN